MAATGVNSLVSQLQQHWFLTGMPADTFGEAGEAFLYMSKRFGSESKLGGDNLIQHPVRSQLQGGGGNNFNRTLANHVSPSGERFVVPVARHWEFVRILDRLMALNPDGKYMVSKMSALMDTLDQAAKSWMRGMSYLLWSDGRQLLAKGDGAYAVAGTTITFLNSDNVLKFEIGDVIRLISTATAAGTAPGVVPAAEVGSLTVTNVTDTGLEVDQTINVAIPTATNADYISKDNYQTAGATDPDDVTPFTGIFGYLAETNTLANATFYGVDRSKAPNRLAGSRVALSGSETPWTIVSKIMQRARKSGAKIDTIYIPSSQVEAMMEELASRNIQHRPVYVPPSEPQHLVIGVTAIEALYGSMAVKIVDDRFMSDPDVTSDQDRRYVALNTADMVLDTTQDAVGWKDYDGDGTYVQQEAGEPTYKAQYGAFCQYLYANPKNAVIAKVGADA